MQKVKIGILLLLLTQMVQAAPNQKSPNQKSEAKSYRSKFSEELLVQASQDAKNASIRDLVKVINGLNTLIKIEKPGSRRNDLLLSKASAYINLAKAYRVSSGSPKSGKDTMEKYKGLEASSLKRAIEASQEVLASKEAGNVLRSRSHYIIGLSRIGRGEEDMAVDSFNLAMKENPANEVNPRLSLFVAERLFELQKFDEAIKKYAVFFSRMTNDEKALATYKTAWCYLSLKNFMQTEKIFLKIAGKSWAKDFGKDAIRDLAYVVTLHRGEEDIIRFAHKGFPNVKDREVLLDFLTDTYSIYLRQSGNQEKPLIYNEVMRLEKRAERRVSISIKRLNAHQKDYASELSFRDYLDLQFMIKKAGLKPGSEKFNYFANDLELELQRLIKSHVETLIGKVKSPEGIEKRIVSLRTEQLVNHHIEWFPESPQIEQSFSVALDNCQILKDSNCTVRYARAIIANKKLSNLRTRARVDLLVALETLKSRDPKLADQWFAELKDFVDKEGALKEWLIFAKKLTVEYNRQKKFEENRPYLVKVFEKENTTGNLFRIAQCDFELAKYDQVIDLETKIPPQGENIDDIRVLIRESHLRLAQVASESKDFDKYEGHIQKFLGLQNDEKKADLARVDYFSRLMGLKSFSKVVEGLASLPAAKRYSSGYAQISEQLVVNLLLEGQFKTVLDYLKKDTTYGKFKSFDRYRLRAQFATSRSFDGQDLLALSEMSEADRNSILSLLSLSSPQVVEQYFARYTPKSKFEKQMELTAIQILQGDWEPMLTDEQMKRMKEVLPATLFNVKEASSENFAKVITIPTLEMAPDKQAKFTEQSMTRVRQLRGKVATDLQGRSVKIQKRIIENAKGYEKKLADFLKSAPVPEGVTGPDAENYKKELASVAAEFDGQAAEYDKMIAQLEAGHAQANRAVIEPPSLDDWPEVSGDIAKRIEVEFAAQNNFGAFVILESARIMNAIESDDYYKLRGFCIFRSFSNKVTASLFKAELEAAGQTALLDKWKKLVEKEEGK